ncbi:helix-turn-helix domain-containing protein [Rhodanobacter umsongensis]
MATAKKAAQAPKSLYRAENQVFLQTLRTLREQHTGLNQTDFAAALGRSQTYVSSAERGAVRLDGLQLRDWCVACGVDLVTWATEIERQLGPVKRAPRKSVKQK